MHICMVVALAGSTQWEGADRLRREEGWEVVEVNSMTDCVAKLPLTQPRLIVMSEYLGTSVVPLVANGDINVPHTMRSFEPILSLRQVLASLGLGETGTILIGYAWGEGIFSLPQRMAGLPEGVLSTTLAFDEVSFLEFLQAFSSE